MNQDFQDTPGSQARAYAKNDIAEINAPSTSAVADRTGPESRASFTSRGGLRTMWWLLIVVLAVIVMVLAMWGRMNSNATSTVNPQKSQPAPGR